MVAGVLVVGGAFLRLAFAVRAGVGYDEVFVIGLGLDELQGPMARWLLETPLRRSDAVTPLWWWVQAIPALVLGFPTQWGIRTIPIVFGLASLLLTCRLAPRSIGKGPALLLLAFVSFSDIGSFVSARGEFAEPMLLFVSLWAVLLVGNSQRFMLKGFLWFILLFTHVGKGALIVSGLICAELVFAVIHRRQSAELPGKRSRGTSFGAGIVSTLIAVVPTLAWLLLVNGLAFQEGPILTDTGPRASVWAAIAAITAGYSTTKEHMIASSWDTAQLYLDGAIWPVSTILAVPMAVGMVAALRRAIRAGGNGCRNALVLSLVPWFLGASILVIGRGMVGGRFHLLYLPAAWAMASIGLGSMRRARASALILSAILWSVHLGVAFSWSSWSGRHAALSPASILVPATLWIVLGFVTMPILFARFPRRTHRAACFALVVAAAGVNSFYGPMRWLPAARFEPMAERVPPGGTSLLFEIDAARSEMAAYPAAHGRTLHIDLANYFLTKPDSTPQDAQKATRYAQLATVYDRDAARAWVYLGLAYRKLGRPVEEIRDAWQRSYALRPDPRVAEWLAQLP